MRHSTLLLIENLENSVHVYMLHTTILNSYVFDSAFEMHSEIIIKTPSKQFINYLCFYFLC